jgi:hypothetical protein
VVNPAKVRSIDALQLTSAVCSELETLLTHAKQDPFLFTQAGDVLREGDKRMAILYQDKVIGFYSPQTQSFQGKVHHRAGALYLAPVYRGQGIMANVLASFFKGKLGISWINDTNASSIQLFTKLGFVQDKPHSGQDGKPGHWYVHNSPNASQVVLEALSAHPTPRYLAW